MRLLRQIAAASGYLCVLIAPCLLALASRIDEPYLVIGVVLLVFPLARVVFGALPTEPPPDWHEAVAGILHWLPRVYAAVLAAAVGALALHVSAKELTYAAALGWALSLWVTMVFATCVAHELLHRRTSLDRLLGSVLAGFAGYPVLGYEHIRHHRLAGSTKHAEWPRLTESVWSFAGRRLTRIATETLGLQGIALRMRAGSTLGAGVRLGLAASAVTGLLFVLASGWLGAAIYGLVVVLVAFSIQLVTYMQHWGLGDDHIEGAALRELGWEDDCRFQAWVTMALSLHQAHHRQPALPYYRVALAADSPRLPAGYVLLMFTALWPALWQRVMRDALDYWHSGPVTAPTAGRGLYCTAIYRRVSEPAKS